MLNITDATYSIVITLISLTLVVAPVMDLLRLMVKRNYYFNIIMKMK